MQCCRKNMLLDNMPDILDKNPAANNNYLVIIPLDDEIMSFLNIPFQLHGRTSYFLVWAANLVDYESDVVPKIHLTAEAPDWNIGSSSY